MEDIRDLLTDGGDYLESLKEFRDLEREFKKRTIMRIMKKRYDAGRYLSHFKAIEDKIPKPVKKESNLRDWVWLTINPKPDIELIPFMKILDKAVHRKLWERYYYVLEQRGTIEENNLGKGFHAHLLLRRSPETEYKHTKRQMRNSFKNVCNVDHDKVFYWKECREDFLDDKMEYITNIKTMDGKELKQKGDILWRKQHNILKLYEGPESSVELPKNINPLTGEPYVIQ